MSKPTLPIEISAKTDNVFIIEAYADSAETIPFDYTGYVFESGIKLKTTDKVYLAEFTVTTIPSAAFPTVNHCIKLYLSKESSSVLNGKVRALWDIHVIPQSGPSYRPYAPSTVTIIDGVSDVA